MQVWPGWFTIGPLPRVSTTIPVRGSAKLILDPALPVREGLARAMRAVLAHAAQWAGRARSRPIQAVHELRKSIRRARALLRLTRDLLPERTADALAEELREAQAAASALRDTDVLLQTLRGKLGLHPTPAQKRMLSALASDLRVQQRQARGVIAGIVGRSAGVLSAVGARYARALPGRIDPDAIERGLRDSYRRTRRRQRRAHGKHGDEPFHDWRKSTKALSYQLELLASGGFDHTRKARRQIADLAEAQGEVTDLMLLRRRLEGGAAADRETARLVRRLQALIDRRRKKVVREGKRALAQRARRFVPSLS